MRQVVNIFASKFRDMGKNVSKSKEVNKAKANYRSVLEAFERIVEQAKDSNLSQEFFEEVAAQIKYAAGKLNLSKMQTVMLALFVDRSEDNNILLSELATYTGCRTTRFLRLSSEIDELVERHYLRLSNARDRTSYRVPNDVLQALKKNQPYDYVPETVTDVQSFFDRFSEMMQEKENGEVTYDAVLNMTDIYLEELKETYFVRSLKKFEMDDEQNLLFIFMAYLFVENSDDFIGFNDIEDLYDNRKIPRWCKSQLRSHTSELFENKLIENVNEDGMARSDRYKLTDFAKNDVLSELNLNLAAKADRNLIKADSFAEKTLIYNPSEEKQVAEFKAIVSGDRFAQVQSRLRENGMRSGFCALFYGSPGTGKTETVYQIAKATGRDIMRVDVDKIKSCWVGESEQKMKKVFDDYRNACRDTSLAPILLFNEADAILGVRMEGATRAVDKMENSIQNIILQEMEALDGIMIATTNLTTNLDKAFERRFLYKIQFNRPTLEARAQIWRAMMPGLSEADSLALASQFDLSGGEIENISRKQTVNAILSGTDIFNLRSLVEICRNERIAGPSGSKKIGF